MMSSAEDERQVINLINRYAHALDSANWPLLRTVWADDVDADFGTGETWNSGDSLNEFMEKFHTGLKTMHMNGNHAIDDAGPGKAKGRTYVKAVLYRPDGSLQLRFGGWYNDEFAKIGGEWKITKRQVDTIEFEAGPAAN
jgi:hypothetical protein